MTFYFRGQGDRFFLPWENHVLPIGKNIIILNPNSIPGIAY